MFVIFFLPPSFKLQQKEKSYFLPETVPVHKDAFEMPSQASLAGDSARGCDGMTSLAAGPAPSSPASSPHPGTLPTPALQPEEVALAEWGFQEEPYRSSLKHEMSGDQGPAHYPATLGPQGLEQVSLPSELYRKKGLTGGT